MMAKKPGKAVSKKECPSCGLGVTENLSICEFCGWDFEEEDEWILQIEKLERDLMLEKQEYEPGTVNHRIEGTLRTPVLEQAERTVPAREEAIDIGEEEAEERVSVSVPERKVRTPAPIPEKPSQPKPITERKAADVPVRKVKTASVEADASVSQRKVRTVASPPSPPEPEEKTPPVRKTRTVRKVKQ